MTQKSYQIKKIVKWLKNIKKYLKVLLIMLYFVIKRIVLHFSTTNEVYLLDSKLNENKQYIGFVNKYKNHILTKIIEDLY